MASGGFPASLVLGSNVLGLVLSLGGVSTLVACNAPKSLAEDPPAAAKVALAPQKAAEIPVDEWALVPVPPEDGPKLAPLVMRAKIYPKPDQKLDPIGYLRVGARVARSAKPVSQRDCPGGWFAIRPVGFVCAGEEISLDLNSPVARAIQVEPDRSRPMPYAYAFVRAIAPNYMRVPTTKEQFEYEMRLERHLRNYRKLGDRWDTFTVGANDVPLDARGLGANVLPEQPLSMDVSHRFGGNGNDSIPWWLQNHERRIPNLSSFRVPHYAVIGDRVKRHAGLALIGSFVAEEDAQRRRFAISADARLVPADKLKPDSGSPFHGRSLSGVGLPVAFTREAGSFWWTLKGGQLTKGERVGWREFVPLTGNVRMVGGERVVEAKNGLWLRSDDLKTAAKPSELPSWAKQGTKWIDISIVSQTLVLWEGDTPVYATLVSTGKDGLGDPKETLSTPQGTFRVYQKHVTTTMDSEQADHEFELRDVPWVMYFKGGYAIHAAYWHDDFGRVRSHGCVNLAPIDARYVFRWSSPDVPEHWHAGYVSDSLGKGTIVNIHK